jgi:hypothetical protein
MKRLFSISTVVVLLVSVFSPVWAADMDMQGGYCHRMQMQSAPAQHDGKHARMHHHCDGMGEGMEGMNMAAAQPSDGISIAATHSSCPMNCCVQGTPTSGIAIAAASFLPSLAAADAEFHFASIIFASAGFSSHTDRGPPIV